MKGLLSKVAGFGRKMLGASMAALAAVGAVGTGLAVTANNAMAQASGFGAAVTGTIDDTKADVVLIGVAVLAVIVLIAAIAWVSRAINK